MGGLNIYYVSHLHNHRAEGEGGVRPTFTYSFDEHLQVPWYGVQQGIQRRMKYRHLSHLKVYNLIQN